MTAAFFIDVVGSTANARVYFWLAKIFFGILYKELFLLLDRSEPGGGTIVTPAFLREYSTLRLFLRKVRDVVSLVNWRRGDPLSCQTEDRPAESEAWVRVVPYYRVRTNLELRVPS